MKKSKKTLIISISVIALLIIGLIIAFVLINRAENHSDIDKNYYETEKVINEFLDSNEFKQLNSIEEKRKFVEDSLLKLSKKRLIKKDSIMYDEEQGIVYFEYSCGISSGVFLKPFSNKIGSTISTLPYTIGRNDFMRISEMSTSKFNCDKSLMIYGWDNDKKIPSNFEKWNETALKCNQRGMNMSVLTHTTVNTYRTILLKNNFICIAEHGVHFKDTFGFCVYGDGISENKDAFYEDDINSERIFKGYNAEVAEEIRDIYIITPEFFKHYYGNNTLKDTIVYLSSCMGAGENGNVNYEFAKAFVDECGAKAFIGFHNIVWLDYANYLLDSFTMHLSLGYSIDEALDKAKEFSGTLLFLFIFLISRQKLKYLLISILLLAPAIIKSNAIKITVHKIGVEYLSIPFCNFYNIHKLFTSLASIIFIFG